MSTPAYSARSTCHGDRVDMKTSRRLMPCCPLKNPQPHQGDRDGAPHATRTQQGPACSAPCTRECYAIVLMHKHACAPTQARAKGTGSTASHCAMLGWLASHSPSLCCTTGFACATTKTGAWLQLQRPQARQANFPHNKRKNEAGMIPLPWLYHKAHVHTPTVWQQPRFPPDFTCTFCRFSFRS